jgi:hypothetical protein
MKFKMAAMAGLSLTLDPMGKMFQNASSLKPLGQLKPNCPGKIIGRSSTKFLFFMPIGNPRWPPLQNIDQHWTLQGNVQMPSSQKLPIRLKPTRQECSLDGPLKSLGSLFLYKMEDGGYGRT